MVSWILSDGSEAAHPVPGTTYHAMNPAHSLSRRDFLKRGGLAAAFTLPVFAGGMPWSRLSAAELSAGPPPAPSWVDKPMRWAQLTLVEDDPGKFDIQFWLDYFQRTQSDAVCLSAGGCVAYYPTRSSLPSSQPVAGRPRSVRRARRGLPQAGHGRHRPHRSARHLRRRAGGAPGLDRRGRRGQPAPALGVAGDVGDVRARARTTSNS